MAKQFAWSFSGLESFELCPKKHYHEKIAKDVKLKTNEMQEYGLEGHKIFEQRLLKGKAMPMDFRHHEAIMSKLSALPGDKLPEQKLALNRNFEPVGFFDSDVYVRSIIDFAIVHRPSTLIVDWKFGKQKDGYDQLELCAAVFSSYEPDVDNYRVAYYWAKDRKLDVIKFTRKSIPHIWDKFLTRAQDMEDTIKSGVFMPKSNFLCNRHCPVTSCKFNGGNK